MPELEDLKKIIRSLVVARKGAVPIHVLEKDYIELEGESIPWKRYGNISLLDFLKSIKTHVIVDKIGGEWYLREVASEQTKHISSLVARQKSTSKRNLPKFNRRTSYRTSQYFPRTYAPQIQLSAEHLSELVSLIRRNPNGLTKEFIHNYVNEKLTKISISMKELIDQLRQVGHEICIGDHKIYPVNKLLENSEPNSQSHHINKSKDDDSQSHSTSSVIFSAAGAESDLGETTDDDGAFIFGQSFNNSNELATSYRQNATDETNYNTEDDSMYPDPDEVKRLFNDRVRYRLEKLIQKYPNGIWCAQLPNLYCEEYKLTLNYAELGFNSVREFASHLPEIFVAAQPIKNGDYKLYDAKKGIPPPGTIVHTNTTNLASLYHDVYAAQYEEPPLPVQVSLDTTKKLIPDNVMAIGETVGQSIVSNYLKDEYYMEVFVVEVFTPSFFWIVPRKQKKLLDVFMENIHNFYVENSKEYQVPAVVLEKGLNVACIYQGYWHRGIIKTVKPDLDVTVLFYDYGTLKTYHAEDIYYLHRTFACIPAQAIPCGLYNVKPCMKREKWSQSVTQAFAEKTCRIPLIAMVKKIDEQNNSMLITLTDTTEEDDVHINDWLVGEGMAEFGQMIDAVEIHKIMLYVEENLLYAKEKCYHVEECKSKPVPKSKENINKPLISPQSILNASIKPPPGINNPPNFQNIHNLFNGNHTNSYSNNYSTMNHLNFSNNHLLMNQSTSPINNPATDASRNILQNQLKLQEMVNQRIQDLFLQIKSDAAPEQLSNMSQALNIMNIVHQLNADRKFTIDMKNIVPEIPLNIDQKLSSLDRSIHMQSKLNNTLISQSPYTMKFQNTNPFKTMNSGDCRSFEYRPAISTMNEEKKIDPRYQNITLPNFNVTNGNNGPTSNDKNKYDTSIDDLLPSLFAKNATLVSNNNIAHSPTTNNSLHKNQNGITNDFSFKSTYFTNQNNKETVRYDKTMTPTKLRRPQQSLPDLNNVQTNGTCNNPFIHYNGINSQSIQVEQKIDEDSIQQTNHGHRKNFIAFLMAAKTLLIYYPIPIFDDLIHVFHYKQEGWLSINEFVEVFTNLNTPEFLMNSLKILEIDLPSKSIQRCEDRTVFAMLDRTSLIAPRDFEGKIIEIILVPLKSVPVVFEKLKSMDYKAKHVWNSRMLKIVTLEKAYKDIQQQIEANEHE